MALIANPSHGDARRLAGQDLSVGGADSFSRRWTIARSLPKLLDLTAHIIGAPRSPS
ncbi:MAG: hypothetical protein ACI8XO_003970, partial [Verrucomicrobiales bacterium]